MTSPKLNSEYTVNNTWWAFHKILWDHMNSICYLSFTKNWTGMHSKYHLVSTPQNVIGPDANYSVISEKLNVECTTSTTWWAIPKIWDQIMKTAKRSLSQLEMEKKVPAVVLSLDEFLPVGNFWPDQVLFLMWWQNEYFSHHQILHQVANNLKGRWNVFTFIH